MEEENNVEKNEEQFNKMAQNLKDLTIKKINKTLEEPIQTITLDTMYKIVDMYKDLVDSDYKKTKKEEMEMRYNYGDYSEGSYGRRGVPGTGRRRYRVYGAEDAMDEMKYHYGNYMESGNNYGAKEDSSMKMIECFKDFGFQIAQDLEPKDKAMLKRAMQEVMQELE